MKKRYLEPVAEISIFTTLPAEVLSSSSDGVDESTGAFSDLLGSGFFE